MRTLPPAPRSMLGCETGCRPFQGRRSREMKRSGSTSCTTLPTLFASLPCDAGSLVAEPDHRTGTKHTSGRDTPLNRGRVGLCHGPSWGPSHSIRFDFPKDPPTWLKHQVQQKIRDVRKEIFCVWYIASIWRNECKGFFFLPQRADSSNLHR